MMKFWVHFAAISAREMTEMDVPRKRGTVVSTAILKGSLLTYQDTALPYLPRHEP